MKQSKISAKQIAWMLGRHECTVWRNESKWGLIRQEVNKRVVLYDEAHVIERFKALGFVFRLLS